MVKKAAKQGDKAAHEGAQALWALLMGGDPREAKKVAGQISQCSRPDNSGPNSLSNAQHSQQLTAPSGFLRTSQTVTSVKAVAISMCVT